MSNFKLQQEGYTSTTSIPNCFIEKYMPKAAGEFVKIYIYLLKCLSENQSELSISKIADAFDDSEKDVTRALKYWERKGLLKLEFDDKTLVSLQLISAAEMDGDSKESVALEAKEEVSSSDVVTTIVRDEVSVTPDASLPSDDSAKNTLTFEKKQYSKEEINAFSQQEDIYQLIFIIERYTGHALTGTDMNTIFFFYDTLQMSVDLIEYLFEYCVSLCKKNMRYIEAVAISWAEKGIKTVSAAKTLNAIYSDNCYSVLKAFGLTGRQPAKSEVEYVSTWSLSYGYILELILEACNRTMKTIHQPSFEYADSILRRWKASGVTSMDDVKALDEKREKAVAKAENIASKKNYDGTGNKSAANRPSSNKFTKFDQRTYDYDALEEKLFNS